MGYCIDVNIENFRIKKENSEAVIKALKEKIADGKIEHWTRKYDSLNTNNIIDLFCYLRYEASETEDYIALDYFNGEKLGDDEEIFKTIAPYVEDESIIEFYGEDECAWRYVFHNGILKEESREFKWV